jgi:hypothetical protein
MNEKQFSRDVAVKKRHQRHSGRRDPHMFAVVNQNDFEFWYGITGPDGDHRRFALPLDVAYVFFRRQVAKLEGVFERRKRALPEVPLDDIDAYVSDAVGGLTEGENDE